MPDSVEEFGGPPDGRMGTSASGLGVGTPRDQPLRGACGAVRGAPSRRPQEEGVCACTVGVGTGGKGTALRGGRLRTRRVVACGSRGNGARLPGLCGYHPASGRPRSLGSPFIPPGVCAAHQPCPSLHLDVRCCSVLTCPGIQEGSSRILFLSHLIEKKSSPLEGY